MRTLCAPCHADVTKQQAKERAKERQAAKDALGGGSASWADCEAAAEGGAGECDQPAVKRRARAGRQFVEDDSDEGGSEGSAAPPPASDKPPGGKPPLPRGKAGGDSKAAAAGGAKTAPVRRGRKLKRLLSDSEDAEALANRDAGAVLPARGQPVAAAAAGAAGAEASRKRPARRGQLKSLFIDSEDAQLPSGSGVAAAAEHGVVAQEQQPSNPQQQGSGAAKKAAAAGKGGRAAASKPSQPVRRPRIDGKRAYVDDEDDWKTAALY